jgi:streptogramin lyase
MGDDDTGVERRATSAEEKRSKKGDPAQGSGVDPRDTGISSIRRSTMFRSLFLLALLGALIHAGPARSQSECDQYVLVSGYFSNVHIYDGCSGAFLRVLDGQAGRLSGPQAVRIGPDGNLWVVSENTAQVHRYRADDFAFVDSPIDVGPGFGLTAIAFREQDLYAGGYNTSTVRRYTTGGQLLSTPVPLTAGFRGVDNGMTFGPDGKLYVPGYDSHNVLRHDPATGQNTILVPASTAGLRNARGILFRPSGDTFLLTAEGSGQILEFRRDTGALVRELRAGLSRPTGMAWGPDGSLVVATSTRVVRLDPDTGAERSTLVAPGSGGLSGPTFVAFVPKAQGIDRSQVGTQFWISGVGRLDGARVVVDTMQTTTGPAFGADFDASLSVTKRWGRMVFDFTSCSTATMTWNSTGADSAGFGQGGYELIRLLSSPGYLACAEQGFAHSTPRDWLGGIWYGGPERGGEGFVFEFVNPSLVAVAWFTHRPTE